MLLYPERMQPSDDRVEGLVLLVVRCRNAVQLRHSTPSSASKRHACPPGILPSDVTGLGYLDHTCHALQHSCGRRGHHTGQARRRRRDPAGNRPSHGPGLPSANAAEPRTHKNKIRALPSVDGIPLSPQSSTLSSAALAPSHSPEDLLLADALIPRRCARCGDGLPRFGSRRLRAPRLRTVRRMGQPQCSRLRSR